MVLPIEKNRSLWYLYTCYNCGSQRNDLPTPTLSILCLSLRLVTLDLGRYLLSFKIQKSPTSWINCCKSMSIWQQTFFVSPGSTSHLLHVANLRLTNTFQSCLINHLINSYNSQTGEHCMMACLLIASVDLVVHCLFPYNLITFIKRWWNHTSIDQNNTGTQPTKVQ